MLATPVSGIIAALKAVYDLVQFVRSNMAAIGGLVQAVTACLGAAAYGDSSGVANGVEAALCQAIPLAIDLILRLVGINVGEKVKGVIAKVGGKIRKEIDGLIHKFNKKTGSIVPTFKSSKEKKEKKEKADKQQAEDTKRVRVRDVSQKDSKTAKAGLWGQQQSDIIASRKKAQISRVFNATGLTGALEGNKNGNLGVNLDNSKYVQAIDKHYEDKRNAQKAAEQSRSLHARLDAAGGNEHLLSKKDQKALQKEKANAAIGKDNTKSHTLIDDLKTTQAKNKDDKAESKKAKASDKKYLAEGHTKKELETHNRVKANLDESKKARKKSKFAKYAKEERILDAELAMKQRVQTRIEASKEAQDNSNLKNYASIEHKPNKDVGDWNSYSPENNINGVFEEEKEAVEEDASTLAGGESIVLQFNAINQDLEASSEYKMVANGGTIIENSRKSSENQKNIATAHNSPTYMPSPKHDKGGFGTPNPIRTQEEGQNLLDNGYRYGKQIYNVTESGEIVVYQHNGNTPENGYHPYKIDEDDVIPASVLRKMRNDGKITFTQYKKLLH